MRILLTNDDGINFPGLGFLSGLLPDHHEVWVVAPLENQSCSSHSISFQRRVKVHNLTPLGRETKRIAIEGTPVDTITYAMKFLEKPDLVISGINNGNNLGKNIFYSGTVASALEACQHGVSSLAISVESHYYPDFESVRLWLPNILKLVEYNLKGESPLCLNANFPDLPGDQIRGMEITRQGPGWFEPIFEEVDENCYSIDGPMTFPKGDPTIKHVHPEDGALLRSGYISLTPLICDLTDHFRMDILQSQMEKENLAKLSDE